MPNYDIEATDATAVVQNWDVEVTLVNFVVLFAFNVAVAVADPFKFSWPS